MQSGGEDLETQTPITSATASTQQHPADETGAEEQVARWLRHGGEQDLAREAGRVARQHLDIEAEVEGTGETRGDDAEIEDLVVEQSIELGERRDTRGGNTKAADVEVREVGEDRDLHRVIRRERAGVE